MSFFSAEAAQATVDLELAALAWLLHSVPIGSLALVAAVVLAVSWLLLGEARPHATHSR